MKIRCLAVKLLVVALLAMSRDSLHVRCRAHLMPTDLPPQPMPCGPPGSGLAWGILSAQVLAGNEPWKKCRFQPHRVQGDRRLPAVGGALKTTWDEGESQHPSLNTPHQHSQSCQLSAAQHQ